MKNKEGGCASQPCGVLLVHLLIHLLLCLLVGFPGGNNPVHFPLNRLNSTATAIAPSNQPIVSFASFHRGANKISFSYTTDIDFKFIMTPVSKSPDNQVVEPQGDGSNPNLVGDPEGGNEGVDFGSNVGSIEGTNVGLELGGSEGLEDNPSATPNQEVNPNANPKEGEDEGKADGSGINQAIGDGNPIESPSAVNKSNATGQSDGNSGLPGSKVSNVVFVDKDTIHEAQSNGGSDGSSDGSSSAPSSDSVSTKSSQYSDDQSATTHFKSVLLGKEFTVQLGKHQKPSSMN